jgi:hypothetical protein
VPRGRPAGRWRVGAVCGRLGREAGAESRVHTWRDVVAYCKATTIPLECFVINLRFDLGYERLTLVVVRRLLYTRASKSVAERSVVACNQVHHTRLYLGSIEQGPQALVQTHQLLCAESLRCVGLGADGTRPLQPT